MHVSAATPLNILHTSDWHLGRRLYGRLRYEEFEAFLSWLEVTISAQKVEVLIVAGDIFDTMTPSNRAQALYYEFLGKVSKSCCEHIVIVAGNHDSPTFLDAPSNVLKFLNVHVIGAACDDLNDEVLVLHAMDGNPHCIVAAVPYLRDRDVRSSAAGESADSKDANVIKGIRAHYDGVAEIARAKQAELAKIHRRHIPIIATGHLFAAGGATTDDDGVRDLYVGSLGKISADMFDSCFDYVALGHLHVPQRVGGYEHIRYSGSPIAMGFGEARQQKQVLLVQFGQPDTDIKTQVSAPAALNTTTTVPTLTQAHKGDNFIDDLFGFDDVQANPMLDEQETDSKQRLNAATLSTPTATPTATPTMHHHDDSRHRQITALPIPCFQKLAQVSGDLTAIAEIIQAMTQSEPIWLEVVYTGDEIVSELREEIHLMVDGLQVEVLKIKNTRTYNKVLNQERSSETLQDLNEDEVFERCLTAHEVADEQKQSLRDAYAQILYDIRDDDKMAE